MNATLLHITEKIRRDPTGFVQLSDFRTEKGQEFPAQRILEDPTISLYCLDDAHRLAIFVKTEPHVDLTKHPFYYQAQYEHAQQLIALSYETLHQLADLVTNTNNLILIYSVGRCGSTLLSQVFDHVSGVESLSEPDYFTNLVLMRDKNGRRDAELTQLLRSVLLFQIRSNGEKHTSAIKFRSSGIEIADLIYQSFPKAKNLFLYRDAIKRTRSEARAFNLFAAKSQKMQGDILERWLHLIPLIEKYKRKARWGHLSRIEMSALAWLSRMDRYLALHAQGVPLCAIRYEDLTAHPEPIIKQLFKFCDIPPYFAASTLHVFAKDSQAGSSLARTSVDQKAPPELSPKQLRKIQKILQKHPIVKTADFILPETVHF